MVLGSYQGKLRFDPAAFVADSTVAGSDGSRFVNAGDAKTGTIRFAGFTTKGFASAEAVRIFGRELRPLDAAHVTATIEVAGDLDGRPVARSGIFGATGVTIAR